MFQVKGSGFRGFTMWTLLGRIQNCVLAHVAAFVAYPGVAVMELKLPSYGHMVEDRASVL